MRTIQNRNYNRERSSMTDWIMTDLNRDKLIKEVHEETAERIGRQIDDFYMRYATRNGLSANDVIKQASEFDVRNYFDKARRAVEERDFSDETNEWLAMYNLKMKTSRLEVLKAEVNLELLAMYDKEYKLVEGELRDEYFREIERQKQIIREAKEQTGVLGMSVQTPRHGIEGILNSDFYGASFSERIWGRSGHYRTLQKEIFKSLNNINTDMMGYRKEKERLMKRFSVSENEAMRLLKTESGRMRTQARHEMYKANDFTHYQIVAEIDACELCEGYANKIYTVEEWELGVNSPLFHPNCKCSDFGIIEMKYKDGSSNLDDYM